MKRKLTILISAVLLMSIFTQCKDDEKDASSVELKGTVMMSETEKADGAIIYLSTAANATDIERKTIADAEGNYSFKGVAAGTYFLSAIYNTENNNNLKAGEIDITFKTASDVEVSVGASDVVQDLTLVSDVSSGTAMIDIADGWSFDATHSSIGFNFPYDELNAPFYGVFETYSVQKLKFDQANPSNSMFEIELDFTSVATGSTGGRDGINGCIAGDLGIQFKDPANITAADTTADGDYTESAIIEGTNIAKFTSTSVSAYGNGYVAKGTLSFNGNSASTDFYFQYIEGFDGTNRAGVATKYSSLEGFAKIKAGEEFGVESGHVGDVLVTITASIQVNKAE